MTDITPLLPGQTAPDLTVPLTGGGEWRLHGRAPRTLLLVYVYRGYHCGLCKTSLEEWNRRAGDLESLGVEALFVSADSRERAEKSAAEWEVGELTVGYGWDLAQARAWGLYISHAIKESEPDAFLEPAFFVLDADFKLHSHAVQSMPNARPGVDAIIEAMTYVIEKDYPPRGTVPFVEDARGEVDMSAAAGG